MKMLTVEIVEKLGENKFWVTGRCCEDDLHVGDILWSDNLPAVSVLVKRIELYRKNVNVLHHGYVGGVIVEILTGYDFPSLGYLHDQV